MKKTLTLFIALTLFWPVQTNAVVTAVGLDRNMYTSDFMIGKVVVSVIFPESDGSLDINRENWSADRQDQVLAKIMSGLDWWTKQNPNSPLSFTFVTQTVNTKYEPIARPYYDESLWIPTIMGKLGYTGDRYTSVRAYVNSLRNTYKADWGYVIFVVDSLNDTNGKFSDGLFAYAYLGGPFMVMTYDNNGYGIGNMDVVAAHETGHIFHAKDQYAGASSPTDYSNGYFPTINGNHQYSSIANEPNSIMRGGIRWGLDSWARNMIGWRDSNNNGHDDILDGEPIYNVVSQPTSSAAPGSLGFGGTASVSVVPRQGNVNGWGLTVDTIAKVEYKLPSGNWAMTSAVDGLFDEPSEAYTIVVPPSAIPASMGTLTPQDVSVRVVTSFSTKSGTGSSGASASGSLDGAHAFPNPFKPNSDTSHTQVTFTELTPGAKIQIFTIAGDPVYSVTANASGSPVQWRAVDEEGKSLASGVYYYLITDEDGNKKEGKLAVLR